MQNNEHQRNKLKNAKLVVIPGLSAPVEAVPEGIIEPPLQGSYFFKKNNIDNTLILFRCLPFEASWAQLDGQSE